ncbi:MAG: OsmC family protein [Granulosicoccus sp.]
MTSPNVRVKNTVILRASANCPSHSLSKVSVRDVEFAIDEPVERGGSNLGPTPTDAALAALIGCTNVIGHKCASRLAIDIGELHIDASCEFDRRGVTLQEGIDVPFVSIALTITTSNRVSENKLKQLAEEVSIYCPLSKLFRQAGTSIEENWISG